MTTKGRTIGEVDEYILNLPDTIQVITENLRKVILETSSELIEEYKWSKPNYSYKGLVCYLQSTKGHVNLGFFKGIELIERDPHHLLQGSGKGMRHIKVKKNEEIKIDEIKPLIVEARLNVNEN
ncbi:MAG TPA: DUF1801 domain-containing protein [Ureibacillus sp.]|nr:DUF1801 domain-containing protein [Ureibacillus sp.]